MGIRHPTPCHKGRYIRRLLYPSRLHCCRECMVRTSCMYASSTRDLNPNSFRAILRDPVTFPEPSRFKPERWLAPDAPALPDAAFGFGRRACPGCFMAREIVWAAITGVLAAFEISPVEGDLPKERYISGIVKCVYYFVLGILLLNDYMQILL